jgi:hypothetical protein
MNNAIRYQRFTQPRVLQEIGRQWLLRFFEPFAEALQEADVSLPWGARSERDDVVVYSSAHDEIRIIARTKGERDLYREQFRLVLRGSRHYCSEHYTYTLNSLRTGGADALDPEGPDGIRKIVLRELEVAWDNGWNNSGCEILIRQAEAVFRCGSNQASDDPLIPADARLIRAAFDLHFTDASKPRPVQIRPPNFLKLGRHCDLLPVDRWLCARGFRIRGDKG